MRAFCWMGTHHVRCEDVLAVIEHPRDAIIRVSACAICGSNLHLYNGFWS